MCLDKKGSWKLMGIQSKEGECLRYGFKLNVNINIFWLQAFK